MRRTMARALAPALGLTVLVTGLSVMAQAAEPPAKAAATNAKPTQWQSVLTHYAGMATALAGDTTEGVAKHARALQAVLAPREASGATLEGGGSVKALEAAEGKPQAAGKAKASASSSALTSSLERLATDGLDVATARASFKSLSEHLIPMLQAQAEALAGDEGWAVFHCPMAKASWIQGGGAVANPYFGARMLHCGSKVVDLTPAAAPAQGQREHEHGKGKAHSHAGGHGSPRRP